MALTYPTKRIVRHLAVMVVAGLLAATVGSAAEKKVHLRFAPMKKVAIRNIQPVGEGSYTDGNVRPEQVFDVVGSLNAVDGNQIVIGDRSLTLASGVNAGGIAKWSQVGAKLDHAGQVARLEIISDEPH